MLTPGLTRKNARSGSGGREKVVGLREFTPQPTSGVAVEPSLVLLYLLLLGCGRLGLPHEAVLVRFSTMSG
jgi:hypothetical protein